MIVRSFAAVLLTFPLAALAERGMPCEYAIEELKEGLSYYSEAQTPAFLRCISKYRVCVVADGHTISAASIQDVKGPYESTTYVIVQSSPDEREPVCLIGQYSGGSAATWLFKAFRLVNGKAVAFAGMDKAYAQGDAIEPRTAATMTYQMFEKYAQRTR